MTSMADRICDLKCNANPAPVGRRAAWKTALALICALLLVPAFAAAEDTPRSTVIEEQVIVGDPPLPGILSLPETRQAALLPGAVLLHGSGPQDRDETLGQTKMFYDLAEGLSSRGVAVVRFDKRTLVYGNTYTAEDMKSFTVEEEAIKDALAAARLLCDDPRVDPDKIYLIGHSMGAMIAPRIAEENPGLFAGIILLSGTPRTLGEIILHQNQAIVDALPVASRAIGQMQMNALIREWEGVVKGEQEDVMGQTVFGQPAYYFWEMAQHDTAKTLKLLDLPVLIINGGQDFQVTDADGIDAWRAVDYPSNVRIEYKSELNHLLMAPQADDGIRGTVQEYGIPCHVAPNVIEELAQFILE